MYLMATRAYAKIIALVAIKYLHNIERKESSNWQYQTVTNTNEE